MYCALINIKWTKFSTIFLLFCCFTLVIFIAKDDKGLGHNQLIVWFCCKKWGRQAGKSKKKWIFRKRKHMHIASQLPNLFC